MLASFVLLLSGCRSADDGGPLPLLVIGSDAYEPYIYRGEDGQFDGIDVEISTEALRRIGYRPVYRQIRWQDKDSYLQNGRVDCLWGCFSMDGREERYRWVGPYMVSRQVVVVPANSPIRTLAELNGKCIAVQQSAKPDELLLSHAVPQIGTVERVYGLTSLELAFATLCKGYVDACAGHEAACRSCISRAAGEYRILDEPLLVTNIGVAFAKDNDDAPIDELAAALQQMREDGTINKILAGYGLDDGHGGENAS